MTTYDERKFGREFFDEILQWIASNMEPEEIFSGLVLKEWAIENLDPEDLE